MGQIEAGKGGARRPGEGYADGATRIWGEQGRFCRGCGFRPDWCTCTKDGPGQPDADDTKGIEKALTP